MRFETFSEKQALALTWWSDSSPYEDYDAIICDGAVRSGKTICMGISFICWAMRRFDGLGFGMCGKTIASLRRNVVSVLLPVMQDLGFTCEEKLSKNLFTVSFGGRTNTFYLFGGRDESSQSLIQGATFAGVLLDEVALMPRSFVEQACARCSVAGSKLWFNCNPEGPNHWFYLEWVKKSRERRALYIHFALEDNPALSRRIISRYRKMYSGVFYRRFILGEWVASQGRVYDFFDESFVKEPPDGEAEEYVVSCDYGTANPASFGLWGLKDKVWYRIKEYYYNSRAEGTQKTDAEYVKELLCLCGELRPRAVVVDPSAASFIEALRREGLSVLKADNDVLKNFEKALRYTPAYITTLDERNAIMALLRIRGGCFTLKMLQDTLCGCGIPASIAEGGEAMTLAVGFPENRGIPDGFNKVKSRIEEIIPCHLAVEYRFIYSTWQELMNRLSAWTAIEESVQTWRELEIYE